MLCAFCHAAGKSQGAGSCFEIEVWVSKQDVFDDDWNVLEWSQWVARLALVIERVSALVQNLSWCD